MQIRFLNHKIKKQTHFEVFFSRNIEEVGKML